MTLPTAPSRTMDQDTFDATTDAFIGALPQFETDMNALAAAMTLNATTDTSASSVLIGTGAKTFTVSASKSFWPGMWLIIADTAAPTTNAMYVQVTSYSGTTLVVDSKTVAGSGTIASWQISQTAPSTGVALLSGATFTGPVNTAYSTVASHATTADIWSASNTINWTGTATTTAFPDAPQAGAKRTLICAAACSFTFGANLTSPHFASGYTYTAQAGEEVEIVATSTTSFRLVTHPRGGTYTPTPTNGANVAASTVYALGWTQVANSGRIYGTVDIDPTSSGVITALKLSLPVTTTFASVREAAGVFGFAEAATNIDGGTINSDSGAGTITLAFYPTSTANRTYYFDASFRIK